MGGKPHYCAGISADGVERSIGKVQTVNLTIRLNEYVRGRLGTFTAGCVATRYLTTALAADATNWGDGANPYGTPRRTNHRTDSWTITRTIEENENIISLEAQGLPAFWQDVVRPNIQGRCYHTYRGNDCGYKGTEYFDASGNAVTTASEDNCGLRIKDCELRFKNGSLPFGGLP